MEGVQWLVSLYNNNLNGILADEMGLGNYAVCVHLADVDVLMYVIVNRQDGSNDRVDIAFDGPKVYVWPVPYHRTYVVCASHAQAPSRCSYMGCPCLCLRSTLHNNWQFEFDRWLPKCQKVVYAGNKDSRKKLQGDASHKYTHTHTHTQGNCSVAISTWY